jgi:hypothetical protein
VIRWHAANRDGRIEVRNTGGTLLDSAENLNVTAGDFPSTSIDFFWIGNIAGTNTVFFGDNLMVGDTYAEPLENYHGYSSYTEVGGGGGANNVLAWIRA